MPWLDSEIEWSALARLPASIFSRSWAFRPCSPEVRT